jgi:hypothetical protein
MNSKTTNQQQEFDEWKKSGGNFVNMGNHVTINLQMNCPGAVMNNTPKSDAAERKERVMSQLSEEKQSLIPQLGMFIFDDDALYRFVEEALHCSYGDSSVPIYALLSSLAKPPYNLMWEQIRSNDFLTPFASLIGKEGISIDNLRRGITRYLNYRRTDDMPCRKKE